MVRFGVPANHKKKFPPARNCLWCGRPKAPGAQPGKCVLCLGERDRQRREQNLEESEN